jgi:hypothetical protein
MSITTRLSSKGILDSVEFASTESMSMPPPERSSNALVPSYHFLLVGAKSACRTQ